MAQVLADRGYAVLASNYRLLDDAPWPACGDDCLAAARFLLAGAGGTLPSFSASRIVVVGASAGGHLALMTGLRLPREHVAGIVSMSGVTQLTGGPHPEDPYLLTEPFLREFFGMEETPEADRIARAEPYPYLTPDAPPLLALHSRNDQLVPPSHSERIVEAFRQKGAEAELLLFDGKGTSHGLWENPGAATLDQRRPRRDAAEALLHFLDAHATAPGVPS